MSDANLLQTIFHEWHVNHDARMVEFGGWHMPVQYSTIVEEHHAVRRSVGLFDVAHMGRLRFTGSDAARFLDRVLTNDVAALQVGQVRYALVTNEQGGILDDVLVYRLEDSYLLVVNAGNRAKISAWLAAHRANDSVEISDLGDSHAMLALQGPRSHEVMTSVGAASAKSLKYYRVQVAELMGQDVIISRTGYTGEDGFEIIVPTAVAVALWEQLVAAGAACNLVAAGLGCRDTLRLEAAMPLYGHELNESIDPLTAGLEFGVKLHKSEFIGRAALAAIHASMPTRRRVGLQLAGRRIAREGAQVLRGDRVVGAVCSGTYSPTLERSIAMAYVTLDVAEIGQTLSIDIRGKTDEATVVALPFYKRSAP